MNVSLDKLNVPSPWQEVSTDWAEQAGIRLVVKRDDLIHPLISGNKWRKLSTYINDFSETKEIATFGGAYSNHLLATASLGNRLSLKTRAWVRGEEPLKKSSLLQLCEFLGMNLEFVSRQEYKSIKHRFEYEGGNLTIPEGGEGNLGMKGCMEILLEDEILPDYCIAACGTGTTLAGLAKAAMITDGDVKVIGVSALKGGEFLKSQIAEWSDNSPFELLTEYHFGGYAKTPQSLFNFIEEFARETAILLDPVYTSKAFYAAKAMALNSKFKRGSLVGLVHTGGLSGWFGKWTHWAKKDPSQMTRV